MTGLTLTALLCGCALLVAARPDRAASALKLPVRAAALALIVPLVAFAFVLQVGNAAIAKGARAADRGDSAHAVTQARRAKAWDPWADQPWEPLRRVQLPP